MKENIEKDLDNIPSNDLSNTPQKKAKKNDLTPEERAAKIEAEKDALLKMVHTGDPTDSKDRVAVILNKNVNARNSDIQLAWDYWKTFHKDTFDGKTLTLDKFLNLPKISSLCRSRAKIQNEYNLFLAEDEVRQQRGTLEELFIKGAITDLAPVVKSLIVYIDETGKTQDFLSLGSIWLPTFSGYSKTLEIRDWKKYSGIDYEFHFKELKPQKLDNYKNFITKFLSLHSQMSFKSIIIKNHGIRDKDAAIKDLTYYLIKKGVLHENQSLRAPLPRQLIVIVDEESEAKDNLKLAEIKDKLEAQKINGLGLGKFEAKSSKDDEYIQIVDLFTGAINRILHPPIVKNHKDELAEFIMNILQINIKDFLNDDNIGDNLKMFSFLGSNA